MTRFTSHTTRAAALVAMLLVGASSRANASPQTEPSNEALLAQASAAFAEGARRAAEQPADAAAALAPAAEIYRRLIDERGLHSAGLYYNLGNTLYLSNDIGGAVLAYRRAQRLDPTLAGLSNNLNAARAKAGFKSAAGATAAADPSLGAPLNWHALIPAPMRLWIAAACAGAFWLVLLARLRRGGATGAERARPPLWLAGAFAGAAALCAASLWWQHRTERATPGAVITAERVVGRKGPDELTYQPSFTEPLRAGFEVIVLERRGQWLSVRLSDGRVTWVPASSLELI